MDHRHHVRQVCADAIRRLTQAEQKAKHTREIATQQRNTALETARQQQTRARQHAETMLKRMVTLAQKGDQVFTAFDLTPGPRVAVAPPAPTAGPDELARLFATQSGS